MPDKRPATIAAYIDAAPTAAQPHLRQLHAILKDVAPHADEAIKWGMPFYVEPRFLFAFAAFKKHLNFAVMEAGLAPFEAALAGYKTTKGALQIPYDKPLPEDLVRMLAEYRVRSLQGRQDEGFW